MNTEGGKADYENGDPQAPVVRPEQFCSKISTVVLIFSLLILFFPLILFLFYILPTFVSLFEGMNLTLPDPTKILHKILHILILFLAVVILIFSGIRVMKFLSKNSNKDSLP